MPPMTDALGTEASSEVLGETSTDQRQQDFSQNRRNSESIAQVDTPLLAVPAKLCDDGRAATGSGVWQLSSSMLFRTDIVRNRLESRTVDDLYVPPIPGFQYASSCKGSERSAYSRKRGPYVF